MKEVRSRQPAFKPYAIKDYEGNAACLEPAWTITAAFFLIGDNIRTVKFYTVKDFDNMLTARWSPCAHREVSMFEKLTEREKNLQLRFRSFSFCLTFNILKVIRGRRAQANG